MEIIDKKSFDKAKELPKVKKEPMTEMIKVDDENFKRLLVKMANPVEAQKELAVQIKVFLDKRVAEEMASKGYLSDYVRRWMNEYANLLEKIQKALYGDKSAHLHIHKVTHSQIAAKIRKHKKEGEDCTIDVPAEEI